MKYVLAAGAFLAVLFACFIASVTLNPDASRAQVKDCKAAVKRAAQRGPVDERPIYCAPLTDRQYREAWTDGTRTQRVADAGQ